MNNTPFKLQPQLLSASRLVLLSCTAVILAACGGGGESSTPPVPILIAGGGESFTPPAPVIVADPLAPTTPSNFISAQADFAVAADGLGGDSDGDSGVGGAAGDGAALRRAIVVLTDVAGKTLTGQTDDAGNYLIRFKFTDTKPPFVLKVIDAGGNVLSAPSDAVVPVGKVVRININPLTDKITSDILAVNVAGTDKQFSGASLNLAGLPQAKANLVASIRAALGTAGVTNTAEFDPVSSKYAYDGTGVDAVIESINLTRNPGSGATQLQAKLAGLVTAADGTVTPTLISAATPLATAQVVIASSPALTFNKLKAWIDGLNTCLATAGTPTPTAECADSGRAKFVAANYKQNSKDIDEDFVTLFSETNRGGVRGSVITNPNTLYFSRFPGSTTDDLAVVDVTITQPRTGPLAGNIATPVEYVKTLVFKRDDVTAGLKAGNWILQGNQRNFDWGVQPFYFTLIQANPAKQPDVIGNVPSRTSAGIRMSFNSRVFNPATRTYDASSVYAVRLKGPGLPSSGVVYARTAPGISATSDLAILNKTGVIPTQTTTTGRLQADFRMSAVNYPNGAAYNPLTWPGNPTGGNSQIFADSPTAIDFSTLQAFNTYVAEIYVNGSTTPIVETTRIAAPIEAPTAYVQRPLHNLSPSLGLITPPQSATSNINAQWVRNPLGVRLGSAYFIYGLANFSTFASSRTLPDSISAGAQTSTNINIPIAQGTAPEYTSGPESREIGLNGIAARARFTQSIIWNN